MSKKCHHKFTYTKDDLFHSNSIFSKKKCELCGEVIVLDRKYKTYIIMYVLLLVVILLLLPFLLKNILPEISYTAKGLVAVMMFVIVYAYGIFKIMNKATYRTYTPPKPVGEETYEKTKEKTEQRMNKLLGRDKQHDPTL